MYGKLENGKLVTSETQLPEYKILKYAEIPEEFNQTTHYITQAEPMEYDDHIFLGLEIHELTLDDITDIPEEYSEGEV